MKRRLGLALLGLMLGLVGAEIGLRCFFPRVLSARQLLDQRPAMFAPSSRLPFELLAGFRGRQRSQEFDVGVELDSHGYRGPECPNPDLLCLGDSFTFGHGVEEKQCWVSLLRRQWGRPVLNAGYHGGLYPDGFLVYLSQQGLLLKPRVVLVALFVGNDLDDATLPPRTQDGWRGLDSEGLPTAVFDPSSEVFEGHLIRRGAWLPRVPLARESTLLNWLVGERPRPRGQAIYQRPWSPRVEEKARVLQLLLRGMSRRCRLQGATLRVVLIPQLRQLGHPELADPSKALGSLCRQAEVPFLDLLPVMQPADYYAGDQHWNAAGHARAARAIGAWLK